MSLNKLFVGGIPWAMDEAGLKEAFEEWGDVTDAKVVTDRETGRSRGFGFVTYKDPADAEAAKDRMDGANVGGRNIRVDWAEDKRKNGGNRGGGGRRSR